MNIIVIVAAVWLMYDFFVVVPREEARQKEFQEKQRKALESSDFVERSVAMFSIFVLLNSGHSKQNPLHDVYRDYFSRNPLYVVGKDDGIMMSVVLDDGQIAYALDHPDREFCAGTTAMGTLQDKLNKVLEEVKKTAPCLEQYVVFDQLGIQYYRVGKDYNDEVKFEVSIPYPTSRYLCCRAVKEAIEAKYPDYQHDAVSLFL